MGATVRHLAFAETLSLGPLAVKRSGFGSGTKKNVQSVLVKQHQPRKPSSRSAPLHPLRLIKTSGGASAQQAPRAAEMIRTARQAPSRTTALLPTSGLPAAALQAAVFASVLSQATRRLRNAPQAGQHSKTLTVGCACAQTRRALGAVRTLAAAQGPTTMVA